MSANKKMLNISKKGKSSKSSKSNTSNNSNDSPMNIDNNNFDTMMDNITSTLDTATEINVPEFKPLKKKHSKDTIYNIIRISDVEKHWCCYVKWEDTQQSEWIWADNKKEVEDTFKKPCKLIKKQQFPWRYLVEKKNTQMGSLVSVNDVSDSAIYNFEERETHNKKVQEKVKNSNGKESVHPKKAFLYARTSNPREASIEVQKRQMKEYCFQNNIEIDYLVEDNNVSGYYNKKYSTMNNLVPGLSNFADSHKKINSNHIVLVYKIDRIGRNSVSVENILQKWQNQNIIFHSVLENVSFKSKQIENFAMNKIIIDQVRISQEESDKKSRDLKKRHQLAKIQGKNLNCSASFGFKKKKGKKVINYKEQKVVKEIIQQFKKLGSETKASGLPISIEEISARVCNKLNNSTKYPNRRGSWSNKRIIQLFNIFKSNKEYLNSKDPDSKLSKKTTTNSSNSNMYYYKDKDQQLTLEINNRLKNLEKQVNSIKEKELSNLQNQNLEEDNSNQTNLENQNNDPPPTRSFFNSFFG